MDPMVGSVIEDIDIIGSNSNSALINLCSLCNLQFTDNNDEQNETDNNNEARVEKILDIFLSDNDEHEQVQLCSTCKKLCGNLICTKQSLLHIIDKIINLIVQNSRFTLVNPKNKILPQLFQFRFTKSCFSSSTSSSQGLSSTPQNINNIMSNDFGNNISNNRTDSSYPDLNQIIISSHDNSINRGQDLVKDQQQNDLTLLEELDQQILLKSNPIMKPIEIETNGQNNLPHLTDLTSSFLSSLQNNHGDDGTTSVLNNKGGDIRSIQDHEEELNSELVAALDSALIINTFSTTSPNNKNQDLGSPSSYSFNFQLDTPPIGNFMANNSHLEELNTTDVNIENNCQEQTSSLSLSFPQVKVERNEIVQMNEPKSSVETSDKSRILDKRSSTSYNCDICGKCYRQKKGFDVHVGLHKGEARFRCDLCNKIFTQKCGLQRHLPIHTGEKAFHCTQCDKRFKYHTSFKIHKLTHNGQKPFACHSCDLTFFSTSHLRRHEKCHTGRRPFACTICPRSFSEKYNLETHIRTHTGESAFKCPHCLQGFNRNKKMKLHIELAHNELIDDELLVDFPL